MLERISGLFFSLLLTISLPAGVDAFEWVHESPQKCGMDSTGLARMGEILAAYQTRTLLVIRHDRIVYERYSADHGPGKRHGTASLAKALVGGMSLLLALQDGRIGLDDPAYKYIPSWKNDSLRKNITICHLATHSSGIEDAETGGKNHFEQTGWKLFFWKGEPDPFSIAINDAPVISSPGEKFIYSNPGIAALGYAVAASFRGTPQEDVRTLLETRIMDLIGVSGEDWRIGGDTSFVVDGLRLRENWGGAGFTARAVARVGRLMLHKGNWEGKQLIDTTWVENVVSYAGTPLPSRTDGDPRPASGICWYTNFDGVWPKVPRDAFAGFGANNQVLLVVPSLDLIVVRNGRLIGTGPTDRSGPGRSLWRGVEEYLFNPLMDAVVQPPCPSSEKILGIEFEAEEKIVRRAVDSDNWPITWADDGNLYTAYGDGKGFEQYLDTALSNGFAKIIGDPQDFRAENVRSATGESIAGFGPKGPKASGMLMVEGTLYMWTRNVANSQLGWSTDHARNWNFGFKFETGFGGPALLNFGRNYEDARDNYVYLYSQDGPSAYESYDRVVMARVPKGKIRERGAYEFFKGTDSAGRAEWTAEIDNRGAVITFPGHCQRVDVVYNRGLKLYLMALGFNHGGGWGIFEAPEPWGPWKTAFYTDYWGLGDTHGYRIPSKWIAADGKSFYLVFSGRIFNGTSYDAFCVRRARIITGQAGE